MSDLLRRRRLVTSAFALLAITGCGATASPESQPPPAVGDPGTPPVTPVDPVKAAPDDPGSISTTYPAFKPSIAQIIKNPGPVLHDR